MFMAPFDPPPGFSWVYCRSFKHYRTGKEVRRKDGGVFCFLMRNRKK
jgi:hypothetical protein